MSRLYDILNKMCTVEDITPASVSSFITVNSGYTVESLSISQLGRILAVYFIVARNVESQANVTMEIGTLRSTYRPAVVASGASATFRELIGTDGRVYARPATIVPAGHKEAYAIMYIRA